MFLGHNTELGLALRTSKGLDLEGSASKMTAWTRYVKFLSGGGGILYVTKNFPTGLTIFLKVKEAGSICNCSNQVYDSIVS